MQSEFSLPMYPLIFMKKQTFPYDSCSELWPLLLFYLQIFLFSLEMSGKDNAHEGNRQNVKESPSLTLAEHNTWDIEP